MAEKISDELWARLNTTGGMDTPWLKEQLENWDVTAEQKKTDFMEHMYNCSGRQDPLHPLHGLYSGLWQDFCINEAGPYARDEYFARLEFVAKLQAGEFEGQEVHIPA